MWEPTEAPSQCSAVVQDITGRKQLEERIRQAQKLDAIGTLAGGIAHDFNNILAAIGGYTELARMAVSENPDALGDLDAVLQAVRRATDLVRKILTFSRQQAPERRAVELAPLVREAFGLLRATIPTTIDFDMRIAPDAPTVLADASQIHQVLMNLGTNAWHAMRGHTGCITVSLDRTIADAALVTQLPKLRPGAYAHLSLRDTGSGMSEDTLRRIFEPFFTTKAQGDGTGLGLAVVHGIMDTHGGAIAVESTVGVGTVFDLYFPAITTAAPVSPLALTETPRGHGQHVLVVDDEVVLARLMMHVLTALGYAVETATDPSVALELVRADPSHFALVLTDLTMPGMTGLDLADHLRELQPGLPIMLVTGNTDTVTASEVEAKGLQGLLYKPATIHELGCAVHAAIAQKQS
jgi:nitrogen-specific signal transduction histidine kinase/CheY-like chemotaxis protein